ncbi:MAG: ABC transporter permease [Leucobacter sp.]
MANTTDHPVAPETVLNYVVDEGGNENTPSGRTRRRFATPTRNLSGIDFPYWLGVGIIAAWILVAISAPLWVPFHPTVDQEITNRLAAPDSVHLFGTDELGRDVFSRVMYGAQLSLPIAIATVLIASIFGSIVGAISGFVGGITDEIIMRICDIILSFPAIVLALAIVAALGPSWFNVVAAISLVMWPEYCRLMRSQVLSIRSDLHVTAAISVGCSPARVFRRHVLPFGLPAIMVKATVDLGMVILITAGLSFIGVGVTPPTPEWGAMVSAAQTRIDSWWLVLYPGLAILSLVLAFNFVGDGLRDKLDPQMRAQRRKGRSLGETMRRIFVGVRPRKEGTV